MGFTVIGRVGWDGPCGAGCAAGVLQRRLLGLLLLEANRAISEERLIEAIWGERPPVTARRTLHSHLSRLRRRLAETGIEASLLRRDGGYELRTDPGAVDALRFAELQALAAMELARDPDGDRDPRVRHAEAALAHLDAALELFADEPLPGCQGTPALDRETARLRELRLLAHEMRIDALQALGRHRQTVAELERLAAEYPLRERLWQLLILALYRSDRQADALAAFARARSHLVRELGLEPGPELRRLQSAVLAQDPSLIQASPADRPATAAGLGELQRLKLAHMFRCIDSDGDGALRRADFERHAAALAAARGVAAGSQDAQAIRGHITAWWDRIAQAAGSSPGAAGRLCDLACWLHFWSSWLAAVMADAAIGGGPALEEMKSTTLATFEAIDADGDEHVSAAEYDAWWRAWSLPGDSRKSFAAMDENGDGLLGRDEVVRLLKEFFLTNDPEAAGNLLYGSPFQDRRARGSRA